jgi:hypothetical protein
MISLIDCLENLTNNRNSMIIYGIFSNHLTVCLNSHCCCQELKQNLYQDINERKKKNFEGGNFYHYSQMKKKNKSNRLLWNKFLKVIFQEMVPKFQKIAKIYLYQSYIELFVIENHFLALDQCSVANNMRLSFLDQFNIFHQRFYFLSNS